MKQKIKAVSEKFNDKPLKQDWLKAAVECGLLMTIDSERSVEGDIYQKVEAKSVAQFLKSIPGLGRPQIGEYISKGPPDLYPFHANVLSEYVKTFDFSGTSSFCCISTSGCFDSVFG
jgi:brefeldin A-resistance guanine nucleotide exchange factor 1